MQRYQNNIISLVGPPFIGLTPIPGVGLGAEGFTVAVVHYPSLATAAIYSDDGVTPSSNPLVVPSTGDFHFYALAGRYSITISKVGVLSKTLDDILLFDHTTFVPIVSVFNVGVVASVPANSTLAHTVAKPGLSVGDYVDVTKPGLQTGLGIVNCRVSAVDTLEIQYMNNTGSGIFPTAGESYTLCHIPV